VYALPPLTHNGEHIEIDGHGYVVTGLVLQYKLQRGRYVREHSRLEVQPTGRWLLNMMLGGFSVHVCAALQEWQWAAHALSLGGGGEGRTHSHPPHHNDACVS
jgi:hypothetical protein